MSRQLCLEPLSCGGKAGSRVKTGIEQEVVATVRMRMFVCKLCFICIPHWQEKAKNEKRPKHVKRIDTGNRGILAFFSHVSVAGPPATELAAGQLNSETSVHPPNCGYSQEPLLH